MLQRESAGQALLQDTCARLSAPTACAVQQESASPRLSLIGAPPLARQPTLFD